MYIMLGLFFISLAYIFTVDNNVLPVGVGLVVAMGDPVVAIISVVAVGITLKELDETTGGATPSAQW